MTFNCDGPDFNAYRSTYDIIGNAKADVYHATYMEWGYTTLMILGNKIGLDFFAFRIILSFICLWLFCSTIKHYKANGNLIIGLYMIYLFFFDTIQIRNCISQFIILFATRFLFKKSWVATLKYIVCVAVAAGFHTISWVYLSFLLIKLSNKKSFYRNLSIFAGALFVVSVLIKPVLPQIVNYVVKLIGHGEGYLQGSIFIGYWIVLAIHLIGMIPLYVFRNGVKDKAALANIDNILKVNIVLCLFLPLTLLNNNFNRIFRNNMILTQIGLVLMFARSNKNSRSSKAALGSLILLNAGWFVSDILMRYEITNIISPIMEKNLIFNLTSSANIVQYILITVLCLFVLFIAKILTSKEPVRQPKRDKGPKEARQNKCLYR
ncbi:MAG: EpsG family protein [Clostridia bacterium]|nr:EpsG family protein [Clostridia bacterium]